MFDRFLEDERAQGIVVGMIILVISVFVLVFVGWVYVTLTDPIYNGLTLAETEQQLGTDASPTVMLFGGLGFVAFVLGLIVWFIMRPVGDDIRQTRIIR